MEPSGQRQQKQQRHEQEESGGGVAREASRKIQHTGDAPIRRQPRIRGCNLRRKKARLISGRGSEGVLTVVMVLMARSHQNKKTTQNAMAVAALKGNVAAFFPSASLNAAGLREGTGGSALLKFTVKVLRRPIQPGSSLYCF